MMTIALFGIGMSILVGITVATVWMRTLFYVFEKFANED
jgi:hypothetical protein